MPRKTPVSIQDRICWIIFFIVIVVIFLPSGIKLKITQPISLLALLPLRGIATLRNAITVANTENQRLSHIACELALENARLRSKTYSDSIIITNRYFALITCQIIARDFTTLKRFFILNKGKEEGIYVGAICIAPQGVVGKVIATSNHQSLVQTILDPGFRIAVSNSSNGEVAMAYPGTNDLLMLDYVKTDANFKIGDTIITSGLGGVFPKGLKVGFVIDISEQSSNAFKSVIVQPAVSLTQLTTVYIVIIKSPIPANDHWLDNLQPIEIKFPE
jgi:rod shape-determining protein MreC